MRVMIMTDIRICERATLPTCAPLTGQACAGYSREGYLTCYNYKAGQCKVIDLVSTAARRFKIFTNPALAKPWADEECRAAGE